MAAAKLASSLHHAFTSRMLLAKKQKMALARKDTRNDQSAFHILLPQIPNFLE